MAAVRDRPFEVLSSVDGRYYATAFFTTIFAYVLLQIVEAWGYSPAARLFPVLIGVPVLAMTALKILQLLAGDRLGIRMTDLFEDVAQMEFDEGETVSKAVRYRREFTMILWTGALLALIRVFGILLAIAAFVFVFIYFYERSLPRALGAMLATYLFVYILFIEILGAVLYEGMFSIQLFGVTF